MTNQQIRHFSDRLSDIANIHIRKYGDHTVLGDSAVKTELLTNLDSWITHQQIQKIIKKHNMVYLRDLLKPQILTRLRKEKQAIIDENQILRTCLLKLQSEYLDQAHFNPEFNALAAIKEFEAMTF